MPHAITKNLSPPDKPPGLREYVASAARRGDLPADLKAWLAKLAAGDSTTGTLKTTTTR